MHVDRSSDVKTVLHDLINNYYTVVAVPRKDSMSPARANAAPVWALQLIVCNLITCYVLFLFQQAGSVNLMRLPAATPYAFGLAVVDALFTKQELASSLLFESKKSEKPPLDPKRVETLLGVS